MAIAPSVASLLQYASLRGLYALLDSSLPSLPRHCAVTYNAGTLLKLPLAYCSGFWLLITFLVLNSGPAYAEWVSVSVIDQAGVTVYVDPDTIHRKGDRVTM